MNLITETRVLSTPEGVSVHNLDSMLQEMLSSSKIKHGQMTVFTKHTTSGLRIFEHEDRLMKDLELHLDQFAPEQKSYLHDDIHLRDVPADEPKNGHAHLKSLQTNVSETIPIIDGKLALGKWQSLLFFDFDGPRTREIIIQVLGKE